MKVYWQCWAAPLLVAMCVGCGPKLVPVAGRVVFADRSPVTSGAIEFTSTAKSPAARSAISADGTFRLKTGDRWGAEPGEYKISIIQAINADDVRPSHHHHGKYRLVADKYRHPDTSLLVRPIPESGTEILVIELD